MLAIPVGLVVIIAVSVLHIWSFSPEVVQTVAVIGGGASLFAFMASDF